MMSAYVYILFSQRNGTLYVGVTTNLVKRIYQHKSKTIEGFTKKYNVDKLEYFEIFDNIENAIKREKTLKGGSRLRKLRLIESINPNWEDLYNFII